jgi:hypothetical protein
MLIGTLIFFFTHKEDSDQWDLQLETIKNNILIFLKTLLPMYFFMIIFRFWNPVLQILTSIILTVGLNVVAKCLREYLKEPVKVFFRSLGMSSILKTLWIWVVIAVIVIFNIFFQIPNDSVKSFLNLNDSVSYITYDEMPVDIQNNYNQDTLYSFKIENNLNGAIADFYYDDDYLYLYTTRNEFLVIDIESLELNYIEVIDGDIDFDASYDVKYDEYYDYFQYVDGDLLLFDTYGIYQVSSSGLTELEAISSFYSKHYTVNDQLWLIERTSPSDYRLYQYTNGDFTLSETLDTNSQSFNELIVISDSLFQLSDTTLSLHSNDLISFPNKLNHNFAYDVENKIMYYSQFIDGADDVLVAFKTETNYSKITADGIESEITIKGQHSVDIVAYNYRLFVTGFKTLEVIGEDFEFSTIYNHVEIKTFLKARKYDTVSYSQFKMVDESNIDFLQVEKNESTLLIQVNRLVEENNPLKLPFYTHYGFLTFIPILFACIFELTDYKKSVLVVSFKNHINQEKE